MVTPLSQNSASYASVFLQGFLHAFFKWVLERETMLKPILSANPNGIGSIQNYKIRISEPKAGLRYHRNSYDAKASNAFFKPMTRKDRNELIIWAEQFDRETRIKKKNAKNGALGNVALEVLRYLVNIQDAITGRIDPELKTIAKAIGRSVSAVHAALKRLDANGFIDYIRRIIEVPSNNKEPQIKQTSNAYKLCMPKALRVLKSKFKQETSCDQIMHKIFYNNQIKDYLNQLSCTEIAFAFGDDEKLSQALARIGRALDN